jgi:hypothetical protein
MSWGSVAGKQSAPAPPNKPRVEVTVTLVPGDTGCFGVRHTFSQALIQLYKRDFAPGKFVAAPVRVGVSVEPVRLHATRLSLALWLGLASLRG